MVCLLTRGFNYHLLAGKQTDFQRRKNPAPFLALPALPLLEENFPDKGTYCLSLVTGPQPKFSSVGIRVKFKTAVRLKKKKHRDGVTLFTRGSGPSVSQGWREAKAGGVSVPFSRLLHTSDLLPGFHR